MKNVKKIISAVIFVPIILLLVIAGCNKEFDVNIDQEDPIVENMADLKVSPTFDWRFTENITLNIASATSGFIKITSEDGNIVYYKGNHPGNNEVEVVDLRVSKSISSVLINEYSVNISGSTIDVDLPNLKTTSIVNNSILFDGSDDYGTVAPNTDLNNTQTFTIEGWIRPVTKTADVILFQKQQGEFADISINLVSGIFNIEVGNGLESYDTWDYSASSLVADEWFHFAVVYDGIQGSSDDRIILYINGALVSTTTGGVNDIPGTTSSALSTKSTYIAGKDDVTSNDLDGYMDELRVWSDVRSPTEIGDNMNIELFATPAELLAYYKFDEYYISPANNEIEDMSANSKNIDLFNTYSLSSELSEDFDTDNDGTIDINDDYPDDEERAFSNYTPAEGFYSLAFEDLWPGRGDYDFNDVVLDYRFQTITNTSGKVVEIFGVFPVKASGASFSNGFGFNLPESNPAFISTPEDFVVTDYDIQEGYITLNAYGHEAGQLRATVIVFDNIFNILEPTTGLGVNTSWMPHQDYDTVTIKITPKADTYVPTDFKLNDWHPFIIVDQDRGREVHLPNNAPTDLMNESLFGTEEDSSVIVSGRYFKTAGNLPWAIDIPYDGNWQGGFAWPKEKAEILWAYTHFAEWVESSGSTYSDWYEDDPGYRVNVNIYSPAP